MTFGIIPAGIDLSVGIDHGAVMCSYGDGDDTGISSRLRDGDGVAVGAFVGEYSESLY